MQVDNAAPIPVPVQIRMPRLNMAEACPTPAIPCVSRPLRISCLGKTGDERGQWGRQGARTKLELSGPHRLWGVGHEVLGEVTLHAADHVVTPGFPALADDAKSVVFHDRGSADPPEKPLLHPTLELEDGDFG